MYKDYTSVKCKEKRNSMEPKFTNISHSEKLLHHITNTRKEKYSLHLCITGIQFSCITTQALARRKTLDARASQALGRRKRMGMPISKFLFLSFTLRDGGSWSPVEASKVGLAETVGGSHRLKG